MINEDRLALFVLLGQTATKAVAEHPEIAAGESLLLSPSYDLATLLPAGVRKAASSAEAFKLFFVFEGYLRELVVDVLSKDPAATWWDKVPKDVQDEVQKLEETEEAKRWMALGSRDKSALMTYPQLLRVIDQSWKQGFEDILRDKTLISEARLLTHLRNTVCHMTEVPPEEISRIRQVMRDWFRMAPP